MMPTYELLWKMHNEKDPWVRLTVNKTQRTIDWYDRAETRLAITPFQSEIRKADVANLLRYRTEVNPDAVFDAIQSHSGTIDIASGTVTLPATHAANLQWRYPAIYLHKIVPYQEAAS